MTLQVNPYKNPQQRWSNQSDLGSDFLHLVGSGGLVVGGIDSTGALQGVLASGGSALGVTLSPDCPAGSTTPPCINIPASGACYSGPSPQAGTGPQTTAGSKLITFSSGFPTNPLPQVGQLVWVMQTPPNSAAGPGSFCNTQYTSVIESSNYVETILCGNTFQGGGTPITITAVNPGVSITVSQNCNSTQNGTNTVLFYAPNIFSQLSNACKGPLVNGVALGGTNVHIAKGLYALDNFGNGAQSACGCVQLSGCLPNTYGFSSLTGEGVGATQIYTAPWYNHNGDLGTILAGGSVSNIMFGGGWVNVATPGNHGTIWDGSGCGSHDFALIGFNLAGNIGVSETIYPNSSSSISFGACEMYNFTIQTGDSGLALSGKGQLGITNAVIIARNPAFICPFSGTSNLIVRISGGFYSSAGRNRAGSNAGVIACPADSSSSTNDKFIIDNADLCMTAGTNIPAINFVETSGSVVLSNTTINSSPLCAPGANVGAISIASGVTLKAVQTDFLATGTGNTINNPMGATFFDNGGNTFSGGAGYTGAGAIFGSASITGVALTTGNIGLTSGWGASAVATAAGDSHEGRFTITGAAGAASPTITLTFPTPYLVAPASCKLFETGANEFASLSNPVSAAASSTSVVFTLTGTPVAVTYQFDYRCGP